jgi:hypothetical protein
MNHASVDVPRSNVRARWHHPWAERWWENGWVWVAIAIASTIPLWWPSIPPLVDLPGHLGRYRIQLELAHSQSLQRYFSFHWALIGNLGVDLLIIPLAPLLGLEGAVKLIVMTVPALTVAGIYWVNREVHGRIPPTALFAVPFVYNFPFNFGFTNFSLSMALALIALGGWLRLSSREHPWLRGAAFVPVSCLIWLVHAFGWAFLILTVWSAQLVRKHDSGSGYVKAAVRAGFDCLILCLPFVLMIVWRFDAPSSGTGGFFALAAKTYSFAAILRDRWVLWDSYSAAVGVVLVGSAIFDKRMGFSRKLGIPAAVLLVVYFLMPWSIFGSAYADMRLAPYMMILGICAVRFRDSDAVPGERLLASLGIAFMALRLAGNTLSFGMAESEMRRQTQALAYIPQGARVFNLIGDTCGKEWRMPRHAHLASLVIERKRGFSNDQWRLPGTQLLEIHYPMAGVFQTDPSEVAYSRECLKRTLKSMLKERAIWRRRGKIDNSPLPIGLSADQALLKFPRWAFDYVWVLKAPDFDMKARPGLVPIWRSEDSVLYRIDRWWASPNRNAPAQTPPQSP